MLIAAVYTCASCGEEVETTVDPSQGRRQRYVEDCQVCCRANVLSIVVEGDDAEIEAELEG